MQKEFNSISTYIQQCLASDHALLQQFAAAVLQHKGKFIRPQLTVLVAGMVSGGVSEKALRGAAIVALLHHASLIHDDVIDEAQIRRFAPTINTQFGNKAAVLWGDYILASILKFIAVYEDYGYLTLFSQTVQDMVEGEVMQLEQVKTGVCSEERYMQIIEKKTGSLMGMAAMMGAIAADASPQQQASMYQVGNMLGIAFQLIDDLVDYDRDAATGKMPFMDLKSHRFTLPLLYSLAQAEPATRKYILSIIASDAQKADIATPVCQFINQFGGIAYTQAKISSYYQTILRMVKSSFPTSDYQLQLIQLIDQLFPKG